MTNVGSWVKKTEKGPVEKRTDAMIEIAHGSRGDAMNKDLRIEELEYTLLQRDIRIRRFKERIDLLKAQNGRTVDELYAEVLALEVANQAWLDKWERMECEWCGSKNMLALADTAELQKEVERVKAQNKDLLRDLPKAADLMNEAAAEIRRLNKANLWWRDAHAAATAETTSMAVDVGKWIHRYHQLLESVQKPDAKEKLGDPDE